MKLWASMDDFLADTAPIVIGGDTQKNNALGYTYNPEAVAFDTFGDLFIADTGAHRVLMFKAPFSSGMNATCVLGQADFTYPHAYSNRGSSADAPGNPAADRLYYPRGLALDSQGNLFVADDYNNRVLRFKRSHSATGPFANGQPADLVVGQSSQSDFSISAPAQFSGPKAVSIDKHDNIYVADYGNNRVSRWNPRYNSPTQVATVSKPVDLTIWSSQGLVDTLSKRLISGFELLRTDAAEMAVTAR